MVIGSRDRKARATAPCWLAVALLATACGPRASVLDLPDAALPDASRDAALGDAGSLEDDVELALVRVLPDHGPFSGGQIVTLRGAGFRSSAIAVRFGTAEVPAADVRRIDPARLEVRVPAASPGTVDVSIDDGETVRTLERAYTYDALAISPSSGPPGGGTRLTVRAASDVLVAGATVQLGGAACTDLTIVSPREATCRTPPHPLGTVDVTIATGGATTVLRGEFAYENPFRAFGGLGGGPLDGTLTVLVRGYDQEPLAGALVLAGRGGTYAHRAITGDEGTVVFEGDDLRGRIDVFVSHPCHHHTGFLGADAAYVTAGMRLARLDCVSGGGAGGPPPGDPVGTVRGEITFFEGQEFPAPVFEWRGVPEPGPGQTRAAYVAVASPRDLLNGDGTSAQVSSFVRVDESTRGTRGYPFVIEQVGATSTVVPFAIAGIEPSGSGPSEGGGGPPEGFVAHVVGLGAPIVVLPSRERAGVEVRMDTRLGEGRAVSAEVPADVPVLNFEQGFSGPFVVAPLDRLQVLVRYAVPGLAGGLPLVLGRDSDFLQGVASASLTIPQQPLAEGSFGIAEQELFVILTGDPGGGIPSYGFDYDLPHTRVTLRAPLDTTAARADGFLDIVDFAAPAMFDDPLPADRTLRYELDDAGASLLRITIVNTENFGLVWYVLAHPSVRAVTLPDLASEPGFPGLDPGRHKVEAEVLDVPGLDFDRIDTRAIDSLPLRRASLNLTTFVAE